MSVRPDPLVELLRRCHRDELEGLAQVVRVNPQGLGLERLSRVLAITIRRLGGHALGNILLRGGNGPPYPQVLVELARRMEVDPGGSAEELELRLTMQALETAFARLDRERRQALWEGLGLSGDPPAGPAVAMQRARALLGQRFAYQASHLLQESRELPRALVLASLLNPMARLLALAWLVRPRDRLLLPGVLEISRLRQAVRHRVTVGLVGSPSSGKDAAAAAIFGLQTGNISPIAGSTRSVGITRLPGSTALFLVNTPGLGDVVESVTEQARQVLAHIDVFVYLVNAQGGVQARERGDFQQLLARERPVLVVVNKIDTLRPADRDRLIADCARKLGRSADQVLGSAFDPLPQLAQGPLGVGPVRGWLEARLAELGKDVRELPWVDQA